MGEFRRAEASSCTCHVFSTARSVEKRLRCGWMDAPAGTAFARATGHRKGITVMTKAKHGICIAALMAALAAPTAWAGGLEGGAAGWFDYLVAQLEALWMNSEEAPPADDTGATSVPYQGEQSNLGPNVAVGG
jgi:hypothetical protein